MEYTYRMLEPKDKSQCKELMAVFADAFEDPHSYQSAAPNDSYIESLLSKQQNIMLAALNAGTVVGGLVAYELEKFEQERKEIYLYDLAVASAHRRQGIATTLIQHLQAEAKKRGAYVVYVQADKNDAPAVALYESLGSKEEVYHFDFPIV